MKKSKYSDAQIMSHLWRIHMGYAELRPATLSYWNRSFFVDGHYAGVLRLTP